MVLKLDFSKVGGTGEVLERAFDEHIAWRVDDMVARYPSIFDDKFMETFRGRNAAGKVDAGKILIASGYTSKKDKDQHGFGLMNARRTVERYNGMLKASSEEGSFTLSIILPRES
jgi:hypothetical protein